MACLYCSSLALFALCLSSKAFKRIQKRCVRACQMVRNVCLLHFVGIDVLMLSKAPHVMTLLRPNLVGLFSRHTVFNSFSINGLLCHPSRSSSWSDTCNAEFFPNMSARLFRNKKTAHSKTCSLKESARSGQLHLLEMKCKKIQTASQGISWHLLFGAAYALNLKSTVEQTFALVCWGHHTWTAKWSAQLFLLYAMLDHLVSLQNLKSQVSLPQVIDNRAIPNVSLDETVK